MCPPALIAAAASSWPTAAASGRACGLRCSRASMTGRSGPAWRGPGSFLIGDGGQDRDRVAPVVEWPAPLHRGVQRRPQRPEVRGRAGRITADPLRRGEAGGAHHHPGLGQAAVTFEGGDTEIGEHGPPAGPEQHVARFHVAVQDARRVRAGQRAEHPLAEVRGLIRPQRAVLAEDLVQGPGIDQFHHDPRAAVGLDDVEDGHHRRDDSAGPRSGPRAECARAGSGFPRSSPSRC